MRTFFAIVGAIAVVAIGYIFIRRLRDRSASSRSTNRLPTVHQQAPNAMTTEELGIADIDPQPIERASGARDHIER